MTEEQVNPRNIPVPLFIDQVMQNDLQWFVEHFKDQNDEDVSIADVIYDMLDDVIDVWADNHSHTGICGTCESARLWEGPMYGTTQEVT